MDAGHRITAGEVSDHLDHMVLHFAGPGVHADDRTDFVGMRFVATRHMIGGERCPGFDRGAIRIEPGMDANIAFPRLAYAESKRIITGVLALCSGKKATPRLQRRTVKGVAFGAHLEKNIGQAERLGRVENADEFRFLFRGGQAFFRRPVEVVHG